MKLINDTQSLKGAKSFFGSPIPTYDDGYGPLFIHRDSIGISGIVRARTWEDAYSICEDEFFPEASETIEELKKDYNFTREHVKIVQGVSGNERDAIFPDDYPNGKLEGVEFVRWETRETPCEDSWSENELFREAFGFRPNGPNVRDTIKHGIYTKDLNGDSLDILTPALLEELEITLEITSEDGEVC